MKASIQRFITSLYFLAWGERKVPSFTFFFLKQSLTLNIFSYLLVYLYCTIKYLH